MENMKHNFHSTNLNLYLYEFDQKKLQISSKYFFTDFFVRTSFLIEFEFEFELVEPRQVLKLHTKCFPFRLVDEQSPLNCSTGLRTSTSGKFIIFYKHWDADEICGNN